MSQTLQTRSFKSYFILFLLASLQITLSDSHPLSTTQDQLGQGTGTGTATSSSPAPASCGTHQNDWDHKTTHDLPNYLKNCKVDEVTDKNTAGTLQQSDLANCYRPHCDSTNSDIYLAKQCSFLFEEWCWCSTPDGQAVFDTFQKNMPDGFCTIQRHCHVDGKNYDINSIFTLPSVCGLCECHSDGTHTCFIDYTVDANNQLSDDQLEILKKDLLQVFKLQHNQMGSPVDVRKIRNMSSEVSDDEKDEILSSKFTSYDKDKDNALNRFEEFIFHTELGQLFGCRSIFNHLSELMDSSNDNEISLQEWNAFFGLLTAVSEADESGDSPTQSVIQKREAPLDIRKPLHLRKKFQYVIS